MTAVGLVRSWLFRVHWIATAAALGGLLVAGAGGVSRSFALLMAAVAGLAMHGWVVWRGVWHWDGGVNGRTGFRSILTSVSLGMVLLVLGFYVLFWRVWSPDWRVNATLGGGWLLLAVLPSKLINVHAVRSWTRRHGMGDFCRRCDALLVADNRLVGSTQGVGPSGHGLRRDQYGGKRCMVCGVRA